MRFHPFRRFINNNLTKYFNDIFIRKLNLEINDKIW